VIGIIAILIAILLPTLGRAKNQATTVACLANLRSIGQAIQIYATQNRGALPYGYWDGVGSPDGTTVGGGNNAADWQLLLMSSALGKGGATYGTQAGAENTKLQEAFACPAASPDSGNTAGGLSRKLHYSSHPRLMPNLDDYDQSKPPPRPLLQGYRLGKVRRSTEIVLVFDGSQIFNQNYGNAYAVGNGIDDSGLYKSTTANGRSWNYLLTKPGLDLGVSVKPDNRDFSSSAGSRADIRWRHGKNDTANFCFADGHAESRRLKASGTTDLKLSNVYIDP
jgi:prepilin-type processing-associated H-X9-DG protein